MQSRWRAPAKVNLTLHILGRREDGWHDLDSIVAFAGVGDTLEFSVASELALEVEGPSAAMAGPRDDNLVLRASRRLAERAPNLKVGRFRLKKSLPIAAGLGGGSSDAAAALRALAAANSLALDDPRIVEAARATGADVAVCLDPRARVMAGVGDRLGPPLELPKLHATLVNPGVAVGTPEVFARLGLAKGEKTGGGPSPEIDARSTARDIIGALREGRNDMQEAAVALAPVIGEVLDTLGGSGALIARMSGSGATCFGLFDNRAASLEAAMSIQRAHPGWWVKATVLR